MSKNHEKRQKNVRLAGASPSIKLLAKNLTFESCDKENLEMAQNESSQAFRKYFVYGAVFGVTVTLIVWYLLKFFQ